MKANIFNNPQTQACFILCIMARLRTWINQYILFKIKITINTESDWKYGEPSIYADEYMEWLTVQLWDQYVDPPEDIEIIEKNLGYEYTELMKHIDEPGFFPLVRWVNSLHNK